MTTGYTCHIASGKVTTLADFAKICVRAMPACGSARDRSLDVDFDEIVRRITQGTLRANAVENATNALTDFESMSRERIKQLADDANLGNAVSHEVKLARFCKEKSAHQRILEELNKWHPPAMFHDLKRFMKRQLCMVLEEDYVAAMAPVPPKTMTTEEYYETRRKQLQQALSKAEKSAVEDTKLRMSRGEYLFGLIKELEKISPRGET